MTTPDLQARLQTPQGLLLWARFEGLAPPRAGSMACTALAPPAATSLRDIERVTIDRVLQQLAGNVAAAARQLGISRNSV